MGFISSACSVIAGHRTDADNGAGRQINAAVIVLADYAAINICDQTGVTTASPGRSGQPVAGKTQRCCSSDRNVWRQRHSPKNGRLSGRAQPIRPDYRPQSARTAATGSAQSVRIVIVRAITTELCYHIALDRLNPRLGNGRH